MGVLTHDYQRYKGLRVETAQYLAAHRKSTVTGLLQALARPDMREAATHMQAAGGPGGGWFQALGRILKEGRDADTV